MTVGDTRSSEAALSTEPVRPNASKALEATSGGSDLIIGVSLTEVKEDGQLVGEVAESWEATPDAKKWVFKLRKGIEFHNGKSLTADDVIASINFHRGEQSKSGGKVLVEAISEIKSDGP